jgi:hypothetical protein
VCSCDMRPPPTTQVLPSCDMAHVPGSRIVPRIDCFLASAPARVCVHGVGVAGVWGYPSSLTVVVADHSERRFAQQLALLLAQQCVILDTERRV